MFKKSKKLGLVTHSYSARRQTRQQMVSFLKLGSCKVLVGKKKPNSVFKKRHKILFCITAAIIITGMSFVLF